ncbi:MAG: Re/Si-specific NAD(P)(+) transhydrogenase subunit alpha [Bdellovibrio sp.]|nr:Re/Si-specific NAD(P)(+) transhydrogenase subunit alpha [Bdellovibrio sp.]
MVIGIPKETGSGETRVAVSPEAVKKLVKRGFRVWIEKSAGTKAGFPDEDFQMEGVEMVDAKTAFSAQIVAKILKPSFDEIGQMKKGSVLVSLIEPYKLDGTFEKLAQAGVEAFGMELIPRTSRAQAMDVLSSQAGIAGYRAVLEASTRYGRFFPLMMTSAGSAKPAKVMILGAGVAGLQAIATAKKLGALVEAYDVRAEVKEQIQSLGAKFVELDVGEEGSGTGGYAKELSEEGKKKQQALLTERLKKSDIIISTANIPGRKAPVLITEEAVKGMRAGSVIVDMAAANGGNCPLSVADQVVVKHGVVFIGFTKYPAMVPADASNFYGHNVINLMDLIVQKKDGAQSLNLNLEDDIIAAALVTHSGDIRFKKK